MAKPLHLPRLPYLPSSQASSISYMSYARLQPQSRDCHDLRPAVQLQVSSFCRPETPVIYTFVPLCALSGRAVAGRLHNPSNLDSITTCLLPPPLDLQFRRSHTTSPPLPHQSTPGKKLGANTVKARFVPQPTRPHASTHTRMHAHNWHAKRCHTARVPDPGLLFPIHVPSLPSTLPVGKKRLCAWAHLAACLGRHVMRCDAMQCDALPPTGTQPARYPSPRAARRHIDASGLLYGSGG